MKRGRLIIIKRTFYLALVLLCLIHSRERTVSNNLKRGTREHIIFTSFACRNRVCSPLKEAIERNTLAALKSLSPNCKYIDIPITEGMCNAYGLPKIASLFQVAISREPHAASYTYVNSDILLSHDFVETVDFISSKVVNFFIVGARTNVWWNTSIDINKFDEIFLEGETMSDDAQDYFVVSRNSIQWSEIPAFVIARPAYDNWLVDHAYHSSKTILIDASATIRAIHQTDENGNMAHGMQGRTRSDADPDYAYNKHIGSGQWDHGWLRFAPYRTFRGADHCMRLKARSFTRRARLWLLPRSETASS